MTLALSIRNTSSSMGNIPHSKGKVFPCQWRNIFLEEDCWMDADILWQNTLMQGRNVLLQRKWHLLTRGRNIFSCKIFSCEGKNYSLAMRENISPQGEGNTSLQKERISPTGKIQVAATWTTSGLSVTWGSCHMDQWLTTIENHRYQWLVLWEPIEKEITGTNGWAGTISSMAMVILKKRKPIHLAMVLNFLLHFLAKAKSNKISKDMLMTCFNF